MTSADPATGRPAVLVTGATGTLGRAIVRCLRADSVRVTGAASAERSLASLPAGAGVAGVAADLVHDRDAAGAIVAAHLDRFGRLDAVVHCAGRSVRGPLTDHAPEEVEALVALNLVAAIRVTQAALPPLAVAARVSGFAATVYVASIAAVLHPAAQPVYTAAKSGLVGFALALRKQVAGLGIECVAVSPGSLATPSRLAARPRDELLEPHAVAAVVADFATGRRRGEPHVVLEAPGRRV